MGIMDSQVFVAIFMAMGTGLLAGRLGLSLRLPAKQFPSKSIEFIDEYGP